MEHVIVVTVAATGVDLANHDRPIVVLVLVLGLLVWWAILRKMASRSVKHRHFDWLPPPWHSLGFAMRVVGLRAELFVAMPVQLDIDPNNLVALVPHPPWEYY